VQRGGEDRRGAEGEEIGKEGEGREGERNFRAYAGNGGREEHDPWRVPRAATQSLLL
jgi:hypothetical protein